MLPEIQAYFDTVNGNDRVYNSEYRRIDRELPSIEWNPADSERYRNAYFEREEARTLAILKMERERRERQAEAFSALKDHSDPVIKWLMTDGVITREYSSYRDVMLRALPMSREEIDAFGDRQGWCGDYARMLERAERAGVLPAPTPPLADIDSLVRDFRNNYGGSNLAVSTLVRRHLPAILESAERMKAEREAAAAAKAELDKLNAENGTPEVDTTPADVQPRRTTPVRNPDGTFARSMAVSA